MSAISALSPLPDLEDLEARVALENRRCFMDVEPETVLALITHVRALQAENERLLAIIDRGRGAINAAIEQTHAEYANHDTCPERYYLKVDAWREEARDALAASRRKG